MFSRSFTLSSATRLLLAALPVVVLQGCATPTTVSEQTGPLDQRLSALEAKLDTGLQQAMATAADAKQLATEAKNLALATQTQLKEQTSALREAQIAAQNEAQSEARRNHLAAAEAASSAAAQAAARQSAQFDARLQATDNALSGRMSSLEKRLDEVARMAEDALAAMGLGPRKILGKVVQSHTLTDDKTLFPINSPELGKADIAKLDAVAAYVKTLDVNYHIAIHGHTDGFGSDDYNYELGKARAEVVKRYLHETHKLPLLRMSVISHGATGASNAYREGANRRIVVQVLQ